MTEKQITGGMLDTARAIIDNCETDLRRKLSLGELRELLSDNTKWKRDTIRQIVDQLTALD